MNKTKLIIHCSDTYTYMDTDAAEINRWHQDRGWIAIGYNYVVKRDGTLEMGRDLDGDFNVIEETGAHARGFNTGGIGICLIGGKGDQGQPDANFTTEQMTTLRSLVGTIKAYQPDIELLGHCDLPDVTKACPCFDVKRWWDTGEVG